MIDIIARGMIEESNGDISQISEKVNNHTEDSDIHVTTTDKENWNSHPNDITASGNPVQLDGLQGGVPFSEMVVSGKNLIPFPYYDGNSKTHNGITFTVNSDGSVTANGTATAEAKYNIRYYTEHTNIGMKSGCTYTFSGCPVGGNNNSYDMRMFKWINNKWTDTYYDYGSGCNFYIDSNDNYYGCCIAIASGITVNNLVFRPQLELGSTPTEYEPPITGRELTVNVNGTEYTITPDSNPYTVPNDIRQQDGLNVVSVSEGEISVTGVRKNAAVKKIWDKIDELTTAIIVSNGETIE